MPELPPRSAPLPSPPVYSPLPPLPAEPQTVEIQALSQTAHTADRSDSTGSAEWSELLAERRHKFQPRWIWIAAIVLLLAIVLGALYWVGIGSRSDRASSHAIPDTAIAMTPSPSIIDIVETEIPVDEGDSADSGSSEAPSEERSLEELEGAEVSELMDNYQRAWVQAMNDRSMEPLLPYVTQPVSASDDHSVYNIVEAEIYGGLTPSGTRLGGLARYSPENDESIVYDMPAYILNGSIKVSDDKYQLHVSKRVRRDATVLVNRNKPELGTYPPLTTFKETSYTYNVIRENGAWKVQSIEDGSSAPPVCYADESFTLKYERKDGKTAAQTGNCPGLAPNER
ncbi:MAG: hypothetical protein J7559_06200 [Cohnella sp.]|nr:hypothetical protein [Cohnella sp.]